MNFTLLSLSLTNFSLTSPFFSPSFHAFSPFKTHTFANLYIARSCQSFLLMKPYLSSLLHRQHTSISFTNSHFTYFLHSTISISDRSSKSENNPSFLSSDNNYKPRVFNREKIESTIYSSEDFILKAINCFFIECTEPISGGAIDMICEESSLYIIKCCFVSCFAQSQGGAISYFGDLFKANDTCFDGCYTMDSSMAMELYVKGSREKIIMNGLSITKCADRKLFETKHNDRQKIDRNMQDSDGMGQFGVYLSNVIDMNRGKQKLKAINSTDNIVHLTGGFCFSDESQSFSLSYSTIVNNIADVLFNLYDISSNAGNMSYCNVLNNSASLSLTLFDLENSSMSVSSTTFLQNNITFIASNGNLRFENCAYDFNAKNLPLENAEFNEIGSIFHKLKNLRSAKTIAFNQDQIENNAKIFGRCREKKPRYSRSDEIFHQQFNGFNNFDRKYDKYYEDSNINNNKNDKNQNDNFNYKNDNEDDYKNKNKYDQDEEDNKNNNNNKRIDNDDYKNDKKFDNDDNNNNNIFNNKDDDNKIFDIRNDNDRENKDKDAHKNNEEDEDDNQKNQNRKNHFINNQINVADNEEEEEKENQNPKDNLTNTNTHSKSVLLIVIFIMIILGGCIFAYFYFIKNKERDINELQDVELL